VVGPAVVFSLPPSFARWVAAPAGAGSLGRGLTGGTGPQGQAILSSDSATDTDQGWPWPVVAHVTSFVLQKPH
jgi:hypothetical protein